MEFVKDWLKPKSVLNIQVFLGFTNFYWWFIQSFNKIVVLFTSKLKIIGLPDKSALSKNKNSKLASDKNDNSRPAFERNDGDNKVHWFGVDKNNIKYIKKLELLSKSRKKLLKKENLTNFGITEAGPKSLIPNIKMAFNRL